MKIKDFIIDGETIRISKDENGRYWVQYNVGYCPTECGWFESVTAAIYAISKHRHINYNDLCTCL